MNMQKKTSRREQTLDRINRALDNGPYRANPDLHAIWVRGVLTQLLAYSSEDQWEVRDRLEYLATRLNTPNL